MSSSTSGLFFLTGISKHLFNERCLAASLFDSCAMWNKYFTCSKSSFLNLKYDLWWCYHIACLLRINSPRGNISQNTAGCGCHLQAFFTISCFSINVTSTYIANRVRSSIWGVHPPQPMTFPAILVVFQHIVAISWDPASQNSFRAQFLFIIYTI